MSRYCESKARTNKLYCSSCDVKINRGADVVFELEDGHMLNAYCEKCGEEYTQQVLEDSEHPYSSDGHGQD